jgi:hypothetical protein
MSGLLAWQHDGDRWYAELRGREHDYGDGRPEEDVFPVWLERDADGWSVTVEHGSRGGGGTPIGLVAGLSLYGAQEKAAALARAFRAEWEASADAGARKRESAHG